MDGSLVLQVLLVLDVAGMLGLAIFYLSRRQLLWHQYLGWGLVALIFPLLGPFLVILSRPGVLRKKASAKQGNTPIALIF
jgi:hypothetical protein